MTAHSGHYQIACHELFKLKHRGTNAGANEVATLPHFWVAKSLEY